MSAADLAVYTLQDRDQPGQVASGVFVLRGMEIVVGVQADEDKSPAQCMVHRRDLAIRGIRSRYEADIGR